MRLTVIGGSGGYPAPDQPCSGYLLEADGFRLLIDPGYGVATVLPTGAALQLDAVLVSHGHPDHCADLNPILRARAWADPVVPPLDVYAPSGALDAVLALDRPEVLAGSFTLHELAAGNRQSIGPFAVRSALLPHPRPNLGFRIQARGGGAGSLVYTGDCGPSAALVSLADGASVLLAEASYAEEVLPDVTGALSSAADIGRQAAAARIDRLVLTHLMPRTDADAALAAAARSFGGPILVARPGLVLEL